MFRLTHRDLDLLESLARRVRLMAIDQIRRVWWPSHSTNRVVRRRLFLLVETGLIERTIINAHPLLPIDSPLGTWQLGYPDIDEFQISAAARCRWSLPAKPTEVFTASRRTCNVYGSSAGRLPIHFQFDHDLLLSEVFAWYRLRRPQETHHWLGEDAIPKAGYRTKNPDAFLIDDQDRPIRVIESAGRNTPVQMRSFHEHCVQYELSYELW